MDAFLRRLVQRLNDPDTPLTRNRHFHTFETPEGKRALRISKRLRVLQREILDCSANGYQPTFSPLTSAVGSATTPAANEFRIELKLEHLRGIRTSLLTMDEFQLLTELPGVKEAIRQVVAPQAIFNRQQ